MKGKKLDLFLKGFIAVVALIAVFFFVKIASDPDKSGGAINGLLKFTYFVLILALLAVVVVWLKELLTHPKNLKQTAVFVGLFLVVIALAKFIFASKEAVRYNETTAVNASTSNWVDTGLYTFYILGIIAILTLLLSPALRLFGLSTGSRK